MIVTKEKSKRVISSHDFDSVNCTIDAEDMRYVASLLRNNYSNPTLAVVREISANAIDANLEANASRNVEVTVPSQLSPHFIVRDFGGGLSQDDIFGLYSKYGKSTKRESNNYIGAFGIGKFAPLSYGNNFTVVSHYGKLKTSYNIFVDENDDTRIVKLHEEPRTEPTGLSVEVAISDDDVDTFREVVKNFFRFFADEEMPKFIGVAEDEKFFDDFEVVMEAKDSSWRILEDSQDYWARNHHECHAIMGRVHYPLSASSINFDNIEDGNELRELASQDNLYIRFPIGALKLHHSREALEYNKLTQKEIISTLRSVRQDIEEIAKEKLGDAEDLWDAKVKYAQVINALPHGLQNIFRNSFEWDGIKIDTPAINRNCKFQDEVIITDYYKQADADATNGYKVRSNKNSRIYPEKNTLLVIQDLKTPYGNNLRARTLFDENADADKIVSVYWGCDVGEAHVFDSDDGMGFSKINKERFIYFSDVEKAKLQSKGRAVSGESRATVPVFELVEENISWKKTNASYWLNCDDNIDDLEGALTDDDRVIYVPIANYKVVDQQGASQEEIVDLDIFLRDVRGIERILRQDTGNDAISLTIYGVRRKDCKKLTDGFWMHWDEYKKQFAQKYLVKHKKKVLESEKVMVFKDNQFDMTDYRNLSAILENSTFRTIVEEELGTTHLLSEVYRDITLMKDEDAELTIIYRLVTFLREVDEEWVEANCPASYDITEFNTKCKLILEQYPLLSNINNEIYSWQDMTTQNFGKNLASYMKVMDNQ